MEHWAVPSERVARGRGRITGRGEGGKPPGPGPRTGRGPGLWSPGHGARAQSSGKGTRSPGPRPQAPDPGLRARAPGTGAPGPGPRAQARAAPRTRLPCSTPSEEQPWKKPLKQDAPELVVPLELEHSSPERGVVATRRRSMPGAFDATWGGPARPEHSREQGRHPTPVREEVARPAPASPWPGQRHSMCCYYVCHLRAPPLRRLTRTVSTVPFRCIRDC